MAISLREATLDDVERICDVFLGAFSDEPVSQRTLPRESGTGRKFWKKGLLNALHDLKTHVLVVTDDADSSHVIAFAKWKSPGSEIDAPPPAHLWPQDGDPELAVSFFGRFAEKHREVMGDRRHWFLELVATDRKAGGKGAASKLLQWGLDKANEDGLPAYLEATQAGEPIYERKFGFRAVQREKIDVGTCVIDVPFMVREPRAVV